MITLALFAFIAMFIVNFFTYTCFLARIDFLKKYKIFIAVVLFIVTLLEAYYIFSMRENDHSVILTQFLASLLGISFLLFVASVIYLLLRIPLSVVPFSKDRREILKYILDVTVIIMTISWIAGAFFSSSLKPITRKIKIKIKNLKEPISITQITDVHIGKVLKREFMQECVNMANSLEGDIVVITGDLVDLRVEFAKAELEPLKELKSRYGIYYILGNHEYFHGAGEILDYIKTLGIIVLENNSVVVNDLINLAGIYDVSGDRNGFLKPDLLRAISTVDKNLPTVLLSHQPKIVERFRGDEDIDLVLSGHTHGGQIFPFGLLVLLDQPYLYGLHQHNQKTQVFVSSGAGYWGPPLRVFAPSEIVKLELSRG